MRYGIPYKGCKSKYAEQILSYIPSADNFYDLFCGGGAITHCALLQNRWKNYIMNDIDKGLSQLFVDAVNGKYKNEKTPTRNVASNVSMLARWFCLLILLYFGSEQDKTCYRFVVYV